MIRKSIFLGLTIVLGAVLVSLMLKGRREEAARPPSAPPEFVRTARSTATRVIVPGDLEIINSKVELISPEGRQPGAEGKSARCRVEIRNQGEVAYRDTLLGLDCRSRSGRILEGPTHLLPDVIEPGKSVRLDGVILEDLPEEAYRCNLKILHSDLSLETER